MDIWHGYDASSHAHTRSPQSGAEWYSPTPDEHTQMPHRPIPAAVPPKAAPVQAVPQFGILAEVSWSPL